MIDPDRIWLSSVAVLTILLTSPAAGQKHAYGPREVDLNQQVIWGATCESPDGFALSFGGQDQKADDGQPHTRIRQDGRWRAIRAELVARNPLQQHHEVCWALRQVQKDCAARARRLYFQGLPRDEETKLIRSDLLPAQQKLDKGLAAILADLTGAAGAMKQRGYEGGQTQFAIERLALARSQAREASTSLDKGTTADAIVRMAGVQIALEQAAEALDAEPPPRALSPIVHDTRSGLFVLFGGDHLDYLTNDTWVFDPAQKKWLQRHPNGAPTPRANHTWKAGRDGKVVLTGGYQYASSTDYVGQQYLDVEVTPWVYDVQGNVWSGGKTAPPDSRDYRTGPFHPKFCLKGPKPDAAAGAEQVRSLPPNAWAEMKSPQRPELDRCWGTAVLDADRDVILVWNGGHSSHGGTDVLHYHLATHRWELPYPVEFPLGQLYSNTSYPEGVNFNRRPWVTGHTYQSYGYDSVAKKLFFTGRQWNCYVYDPDVADWTGRFPKPKGMVYGDCYYTLTLCATPRGLIAWTAAGALFQLAGTGNRWEELQVSGALPGAVVDASTVVYDSRRQRLLVFRGEYDKPYRGEVHQYDLRSNVAAPLAPKNRAALASKGVKAVDRGCYDPQADLVLFANLLPDGRRRVRPTLAYDCANNHWVSLVIDHEVEEGDKPATPRGGGHSCGMMYDAKRKLIWGVNTLERRVYALRLEPNSAGLEPVR